MTDITRERIEQYASDPRMCNVNDEVREIARRLLSAEDKLAEYEKAAREPVFEVEISGGHWLNVGPVDADLSKLPDGMNKLYTTPQPASVVSDELLEAMEEVLRISDRQHYAWDRAKSAIAACRASTLLSSTDKPAPELDSEAKNGELSSSIPTGWKLVPIEPTEDMIIDGFESEPREAFSSEGDWDEYEAMSGCQQAAHRAKLCWAAMLAAAPQPEGESVEPTIGIDLSGHIRKAIREEVLDVLNEERRCGGALSKW